MLCAGTVAAMVYNTSMGRPQGSEPLSAIDFVPEMQKPKTDDELIADMNALFASHSLKRQTGV